MPKKMLQTVEQPSTSFSTTSTAATTPTDSSSSSSSSTRRRSTFYVPLITESDDIVVTSEKLSNCYISDTSSNKSDNSLITTVTVNSITPKVNTEITTNKFGKEMSPPCGFDWSFPSTKMKDDKKETVIIRTTSSSNKQTPQKNVNSSNNKSVTTATITSTTKTNNKTQTTPTVRNNHNSRNSTSNNTASARMKRYGIVLNGISLDDEANDTKMNTTATVPTAITRKIDTFNDKTNCQNSIDSVHLDADDDDDDSDISRIQTNTSTPIKLMKSRSRTNILSVPQSSSERSLIVPPTTTPNGKVKSKTLPQNMSPSAMKTMENEKSNNGGSGHIGGSGSGIISNTFPPKNLFLLKSTPKIMPSSSSSDTSVTSPASNNNSVTQISSPPSKKSLSFIRRAHSTKLSRSNSLLKSLTSKSSSSSVANNGASSSVVGFEVRPLPFERLEKFLKSEKCTELMKDYFLLKDAIIVDSSNSLKQQQASEEEENAIHSDTSYEKACRRGSAPATPILGQKQPQQENQTTSRFTNFFSKRSNPLKRTKSVTKLERSKRGPGGLRGSRSHESLLSSHAVMSTIDLSCTGAVGVAPVHQSVLGRRHCFQVRGGPRGERYYSCGSRQERDLWIYSLRKSIAPNAEHTRRTDNSLKMWIYEAKCLPAKKKYFCEINLDKTLYGRTSVKLQTDLLFWGEYFDFPDIPDINVITVNVFREIEKKKKRDKHVFVGSVKIPIHEVTSRLFSEDWYPILSEKHDSIGRNSSKEVIPTLRIKCRFQSIDILPITVYSEFLNYLKENYKKVCEILEPVIGVKAKEDIGQALVLLMHAQGMAGSFLTDVVALDLLRVGDQRLTFRGNSLATKSMEAFLKLTGEQYLQDTLSTPISEIIQSDRDCEVDPLKATGSLSRQQQALRNAVKTAWTSISDSHKHFPPQLRECFATFRERLQTLDREDMADNLISASIFLRFLCPAILSPSLFNITNELPSSRATRNLTLVAKTLQTLANFTRFQGKENFMEFLNDFLEQEAPKMKEFLHRISTRPEHQPLETILDWAGYIDQGKQLSILHQLLSESLQKLPENRQRELDPLQSILDEITKCKETNNYLHPNQENQNPLPQQQQQQQPNNRLPLERGVIRGVLTPSSLEKNIFRYNDPTVSPLLQHNNSSNSQSSINGSQYSNNQLQHSQSQSSIASSQNGVILIPTTIQHHCPPSSMAGTNERMNGPGSYSAVNSHYFPSNGNLNTNNHSIEKMSPSMMRASTLPRNNNHVVTTTNNNYEEPSGNLIQIGLEPASAFVRKSPTPLLKSAAAPVVNRPRNYSTSSQLSLNLAERSPSKTALNLSLGIPDVASRTTSSPLLSNGNQQQQTNSNCNMPMNLEDLDDLLKYAEEHANDEPNNSNSNKPKEQLTSKGSNISIGHCSSGYQSINTPSQSSSPVEQHDYNNAVAAANKTTNSASRRLGNKYQVASNNKYNVDNNNSTNQIGGPSIVTVHPPLAFKNPLYQMQSSHPNNQSHHHHPNHHHHANSHAFNSNASSRNTGISIGRTSSSLTPSSSEERLSNDNFVSCNTPSVGFSNQAVRGNSHLLVVDDHSPNGHLDTHRTLSGSSSSGNSGRMPRTNPLVQYKREEPISHDSYLPIASYLQGNAIRETNPHSHYNNGHSHSHHHGGSSSGNRYQRRLSLESARTLSDSSTDTEGVCHVAEGKRRRPPRSTEQCEIQRLQASLDSLRHKLDQDAAELRNSDEDFFALQRNGSGTNLAIASESKMRSIIDRLISMEEELRREQLKMSLALSHKQRVIEAQGQQIAALDAANNRLLSALAALRQRYESQQQQNQQQQQQSSN